MNIIQRLFSGGTVEATLEKESATTAERLEQLQARYAEVQRRVANGEATEDEYLEVDELQARVMAASQAHDAAQARAHRAKIAALVADYDARVDATMTKIGGLVAQLIFALQDQEKLAAEAYDGAGNGRPFEDIFGVPEAFGRDVRQAIHAAAPGAQWDFGVCMGEKPRRPGKALPRALRLPRFEGDTAPPPGFSGTWDMVKGEPIV